MGKSKKKKEKKKKDRKRKRGSEDSEDKVVDAEQAARLAAMGVEAITPDSFYEKSAEFRVWLMEKKKLSFDKLTSDESRSLFKKFCKKWNGGSLPARLYQANLEYADLAPEQRTSYRWNFDDGRGSLAAESLRDQISRDTKNVKLGSSRSAPPLARVASSAPPVKSQVDREEAYEAERKRRKLERKREKERRELALDEVAPRETGREAQLLKKRAKGAYARRSRDDDDDGGLNADDLMGGPSARDDPRASMERAANRRAQAQQQRSERQADLLSQHRAQESDKMRQFMELAAQQLTTVGADGSVRAAVRPRE